MISNLFIYIYYIKSQITIQNGLRKCPFFGLWLCHEITLHCRFLYTYNEVNLELFSLYTYRSVGRTKHAICIIKISKCQPQWSFSMLRLVLSICRLYFCWLRRSYSAMHSTVDDFLFTRLSLRFLPMLYKTTDRLLYTIHTCKGFHPIYSFWNM